MTCSPHDLRDYLWEELGPAERRQMEAHLEACLRCREELDRLRVTHRALLQLKDEEVPRRLAFVSDKVFEPSRAARWWAALNLRIPQFALSAALLLAVFFGGMRVAQPSITVEKGRWQVAFGGSDARLQQTVAAMEARHAAEMRNVEQAFELLDKELKILYHQAAETRPALFRQ